MRIGRLSMGIRQCKTKDFKWFDCPLGKGWRKRPLWSEQFHFFWWFGHQWYIAFRKKTTKK